MKKWPMVLAILVLTVVFSGCGQSKTTNKSEAAETSPIEKQDQPKRVNAEATNIMNITKDNPHTIPAEQVGIIPVRLEIPAIHVDAKVDKVGLLPTGKMGVPKGSKTVAWYESGTKPGDRGNAVIDGHVDDTVNPAVFYNLNKLKKGDQVYLTDQSGKKLTFVVRDLGVYPRKDAPIDQIFGYTYRKMLNLITCDGKYDPKTTERAERLVVYTELVTND